MKKNKLQKRPLKKRPFTLKDAEEAHKGITDKFDEQRTLCNVLRMIYRCTQENSYNLEAARSLILEAFWMGTRMAMKLSAAKQKELEEELTDDSEEFAFGIDWKNLPAQGNWD